MLRLKLQINLEAFLELNDARAVDNSETAGRVWPLLSAWEGEQELENCGKSWWLLWMCQYVWSIGQN